MAKKVAVLAVNPVNGMGLFQYLETFYENGIPYTVFAVADDRRIKTNSGVVLEADAVISDLVSAAWNTQVFRLDSKFLADGFDHCFSAFLFSVKM